MARESWYVKVSVENEDEEKEVFESVWVKTYSHTYTLSASQQQARSGGPWVGPCPRRLSPRATLWWGPGTILLVVIYCG